MPSDMVNHLAEHPEYRGFAVQLGVARLQANRQSVGVRRMKFEVPAAPSKKRSSCSNNSKNKRGKDAHSKIDQQLMGTQSSSAVDKVLTLMHKQNDSMLNRLDRMLTGQEEKDSQMSRMLAMQEKKDGQIQQLLDVVVKQSAVIETQNKTVGTIAETEEAAKRLATWKQMQQGAQ